MRGFSSCAHCGHHRVPQLTIFLGVQLIENHPAGIISMLRAGFAGDALVPSGLIADVILGEVEGFAQTPGLPDHSLSGFKDVPLACAASPAAEMISGPCSSRPTRR